MKGEIEDLIISDLLGELSEVERAKLLDRLKSDPAATELQAEYQRLLQVPQLAAARDYPLGPAFAVEVMERIEAQSESWSLSLSWSFGKFLRTLTLTFLPTALSVAATFLLLGLLPELGSSGSHGGAGSGQQIGPSGSFSEAQFEDDLIRGGVANVFALIEGGFGALLMLLALLISAIAFSMKLFRGKAYMKTGIVFLNICISVFLFRCIISWFFGVDY